MGDSTVNYQDIITDLQDKHLSITLGEEQRDALNALFEFIHSDEHAIVLNGPAGSGKTQITKIITEYLYRKHKNYILCAPTHKAKANLSRATGEDATTLHRLLKLKPNLDILELDIRDLDFVKPDAPDLMRAILIVDEGSMVNKALYDFIVDAVKINKGKVIFLSDSAQLQPVKEGKLSDIFGLTNTINLTKIYRQKDDNPLLDILSVLRRKSLFQFDEIKSDKGSLYTYTNWKDFIYSNEELIKKVHQEKLYDECRLLAYTNKRVEAFNRVTRQIVHGAEEAKEQILVGDFLMAYDTFDYKDGELNKSSVTIPIVNANDYFVEQIVPTKKFIGRTLVQGYNVTLDSVFDDCTIDLFVLKNEQEGGAMLELCQELENTRTAAVRATTKKAKSFLWKRYFEINNSFTTMKDLMLYERCIKRKTFDYGFSLSVHKSQGSTINNVLIDMGNIVRCKDKNELRQLQYVAMSRTRHNIHMLL